MFLSNLKKWEAEWGKELHPHKCSILTVNKSIKTINHQYKLHGQVLQPVTHARYLGVTIQSDTKWDRHIIKTIINQYKFHGQVLQPVIHFKYLGVTIQSDTKWDRHIHNIVSKANKTLWFPRHNLKIGMVQTKELAYTLVGPTEVCRHRMGPHHTVRYCQTGGSPTYSSTLYPQSPPQHFKCW